MGLIETTNPFWDGRAQFSMKVCVCVCVRACPMGSGTALPWEALYGRGHFSGVRGPFTVLTLCLEREDTHSGTFCNSFLWLPFSIAAPLSNPVPPFMTCVLKNSTETFWGTKENQRVCTEAENKDRPLHVHIWIKFRLWQGKVSGRKKKRLTSHLKKCI